MGQPDDQFRSARLREFLLAKRARQMALEESARKKLLPQTLEEREAIIQERGEAVEHLWFLTARELIKLAQEEVPFLVPDTIPLGGITVLGGFPGAAKTLLINDLALAISQGRPWLGIDHGQSRLRTLWINHDTPGPLMATRMLRLGMTQRDQIRVHTIGGKEPCIDQPQTDEERQLPSMLVLPAAYEQIMAMIDFFDPHLVVFDSLRQSHTLDESDSTQIMELMKMFRRFASRGASVIVLHHLRKTRPGESPTTVEEFDSMLRGSGELTGSADASMYIAKGTRHNTLLIGKTRPWKRKGPGQIHFSVKDTSSIAFGSMTGLEIVLEDELAPIMMLLKQGSMARRDLSRVLGVKPAELKLVIDRAIQMGLLREVKDRRGNRVIEYVDQEEGT